MYIVRLKAEISLGVAALIGTLILSNTYAQAETIITIPAGTYQVSEVVTQGGTSNKWIRYKAETPGETILIGGGCVSNSYVILDGFFVDAGLDPRLTDPTRITPKANGIDVCAGHVRLENMVVAGVNSVHNGYNPTDQVDCN